MKRGLKNSIFSVTAYLILTVLGLVVRKLFLAYFDPDYLGYEGLFGSMFTVLTVAEMGASGIFTYRLYKALSEMDWSEVSILMSMFRQLYMALGVFVAVVGLILYFCLPVIIREEVSDWNTIHIVFCIQMLISLSTYFLAYRRILLIADQNEFIVVIIDTLFKVLGFIAQIFIIIFLQQYLIFILINLITNIFSNLAIFGYSKFRYKRVKSARVDFRSYQEKGVTADMKNMIVHKLSAIIYSSADNIIISILCGVGYVALFSNYLLINKGIMNLVVKTLQPLNATFGNKKYCTSENEFLESYRIYDFVCMFLATCAFVGFAIMFQPTIIVVFGEKYLLPFLAVLAIAANNYIAVRQYAVVAYRDVFGHYEIDKLSRVMSAIVNIIVSILLGRIWGISGILVATAIGHFFIWFGRVKVVGMLCFKDDRFLVHTFVGELKVAATTGILFWFTYLIASILPISLIGIIYRLILWLATSIGGQVLLYRNRTEFKTIINEINMKLCQGSKS
ncbi:MAG: hypothetical protein E7305_03510 [Butyrivibrio sp.]|nr:hypothetical protein [Butyrivibrio sp.]